MTSNAGSVYHVSSLRYAEGSRSIHLGASPSSPAASYENQTRRRDLDALFEKAEDDYRPGQSSSASLLIRSNIVSTASQYGIGKLSTLKGRSEQGHYENETAQDGFQRTKARALLAQTTSMRTNGDDDDQFVNSHGLLNNGGSIYLRNRRAKIPQSRQNYEQMRRERRMSRKKGKAKERTAALEGDRGLPEDEDNTELDAIEAGVSKGKAEALGRELQVEAEELRQFMPSGSLLETIHYLAAQYYDARGKLHEQREAVLSSIHRSTVGVGDAAEEDVESEENASDVQNEAARTDQSKVASMLRANEGSALVALGVFLEETIKFEMTSRHGETTLQSVDEDEISIVKVLSKYRRAAKTSQKGGRADIGKQVKGKAVKLHNNGWAKKSKRRKIAVAELAREADAVSSLSNYEI
ncbi:hypothetical protein CBS101457_002087 [Exobasidium rhododendri]|nr:hypothetical protein CBS101457_002087 [Exobasidium rhododendri]